MEDPIDFLESKLLLGALATLLGVYGYIPYYRDILRGMTRPHAYSWLIWTILTWIAFIAQIQGGAGPGSWVMGFSAFACLGIFILSTIKGTSDITFLDKICLAGSLLSIVLWVKTDDATMSVILITIIDTIGFIPTFRKTYHRPKEETMIAFTLSSVKFAVALLALETYSIDTALYPLSLVIMNGAFVVMIIIRRRQLAVLPDK